MFDRQKGIAQTDPELWTAIQQETTRQEDHIELIASENYASPAVMEAQGSQLTNKYAEGYPGKRYYIPVYTGTGLCGWNEIRAILYRTANCNGYTLHNRCSGCVR